MEIVAHLWKVNQVMTKLRCPLTTELQKFYMETCKNLGDEVQLPKQNFGPSVMCSHCGSLWNTVDHQVRILRGRRISNSVRKIVKSINENNQRIPKVRATLAKKSIKNEMNKLVIKCSICFKKTELPFKKPVRLKPLNLNNSQVETPPNNRKKKKKRFKDKNAGLKITDDISRPQLNKKFNSKTATKLSVNIPEININKKLTATTEKQKKLNMKRLKHILNKDTVTPKKRESLQNFLSQL